MTDVIEQLRATLKGDRDYGCDTLYKGAKFEDFECVDIIDNGDRRWVRGETAIVLHWPTRTHYAFEQDIGLTEYQDSEGYDTSLRRVERHTKTIEVIEWVKVG